MMFNFFVSFVSRFFGVKRKEKKKRNSVFQKTEDEEGLQAGIGIFIIKAITFFYVLCNFVLV